MAFCKNLVSLLTALLLPFFVLSAPQVKIENGKPLAIEFLGKIDGKSFFVEPELEMNWTEASIYCKASNLTLASIDTLREAQFLAPIIRARFQGPSFWTSAREQRSFMGFVWDNTFGIPDVNVFQEWVEYPGSQPYHYCGSVYPNTADTLTMHTDSPCLTNLRVLCQTWLLDGSHV